MAPTIGPSEITFGLAGLVNLGLAALLFKVNATNPVNRALAIFLSVRGVLNLTTLLAPDPEVLELWDVLAPYYQLAIPFAAAYFAVEYWRHGGLAARTGGGPLSRGLVVLIAVGALAAEVAYAISHGLYASDLQFEAGVTGNRVGPLYAVVGLNLLSYAAIALFLGLAYLRMPDSLQRRSVLLTSVGFALNPLYAFTANMLRPSFLGNDVDPGELAWPAVLARFWPTLAGVVVIALVALLALAALRAPGAQTRRDAARALPLFALPVLNAVGLFVLASTTELQLTAAFAASAGIWVLSLPVLVSYALLKHQLFGLDLKVKWTIKQSTLGAAFLVVFFVVSELAENLVQDRLGLAFGLGTALVLTYATNPVRQFAGRFADVVMPDAKQAGDLSAQERLEIYAEQVRVAWADGVLTRKDRQLLEVTRDRLGIPIETAQRLEAELIA